MSPCAGAVVHDAAQAEDVIHILGDVDESNAAELEAACIRITGARALAVDLTRCRYIGSLGVRVLLRVRQHARHGFSTIVCEESVPALTLQACKVEDILGVRYVAAQHADRNPEEDVRIVALEGEWDLARGNELRRRLDRALTHPRVILDLSAVTYVDAHCLGMLVRLRTQRVAKGYPPSLMVLASGNVRRVLGIAGFHALWQMYDTRDEALAHLNIAR